MTGYTRHFLICAFVSRYAEILSDFDKYLTMVENFYDEVGKDKFRIYCSLDAEALQKYRLDSRY